MYYNHKVSNSVISSSFPIIKHENQAIPWDGHVIMYSCCHFVWSWHESYSGWTHQECYESFRIE